MTRKKSEPVEIQREAVTPVVPEKVKVNRRISALQPGEKITRTETLERTVFEVTHRADGTTSVVYSDGTVGEFKSGETIEVTT